MAALREHGLTIGDLAQRTGLAVSAIRFYETHGILAPLRNAGVTPRAIVELFSVLEERDALNVGEVDTSMYELYCDSLVDLLNPKGKEKLNIKLAQHTDSGLVEVEGGTVKRTSTMQELIAVMEKGIKVILPCRFVIAAFRCCSSHSN